MSILEVTGLTKKFGGLTAVSDVTFDIEEGQVYGVVGPNGAGKTTMFNLISGIHPATSGTILFNGEDVTCLPPYERAPQREGYHTPYLLLRPVPAPDFQGNRSSRNHPSLPSWKDPPQTAQPHGLKGRCCTDSHRHLGQKAARADIQVSVSHACRLWTAFSIRF